MRRVTITLRETSRTGLLCVSCGRFTGQEAKRPGKAFEVDPGTGEEAVVGAHSRCLPFLRRRAEGTNPKVDLPDPFSPTFPFVEAEDVEPAGGSGSS